MKKLTCLLVAAALGFALPALALPEKGAPAVRLSSPGGAGDTPEGVPDSQQVVDVSNTASWDLFGDPDNVVVLVQMQPNALVTGVGWDVIISTIGASWLCEAGVTMSDSAINLPTITLTPGFADCFPGSTAYSSPVIDFSDNGQPNIPLLADGVLRLEFRESFDDVANAIDGTWDAPSSLTFAGIGVGGVASSSVLAIPTLSVLGMVGLGLLMLAVGFFALRRRTV